MFFKYMAKRFRTKLIHIYLHEEEDKFLKSYADKNLANDAGCTTSIQKYLYSCTRPMIYNK